MFQESELQQLLSAVSRARAPVQTVPSTAMREAWRLCAGLESAVRSDPSAFGARAERLQTVIGGLQVSLTELTLGRWLGRDDPFGRGALARADRGFDRALASLARR